MTVCCVDILLPAGVHCIYWQLVKDLMNRCLLRRCWLSLSIELWCLAVWVGIVVHLRKIPCKYRTILLSHWGIESKTENASCSYMCWGRCYSIWVVFLSDFLLKVPTRHNFFVRKRPNWTAASGFNYEVILISAAISNSDSFDHKPPLLLYILAAMC